MKKEVLFGDDIGLGYAGAIQAGPFIFLSACDGFRDPKTLDVVPATAGNYDIQWMFLIPDIFRASAFVCL